MATYQEYQGHQQPSFADLHLLEQSTVFPSDSIADPRWQNIYLPPDTPSFDWMHYRQPEDALSSASSSDSNGSYTQSIYSASSEPSNPLHYPLPSSTSYQPQYQDPFAHSTSTLPPSARHHPPDDTDAWMYAQQQQQQHSANGAAAHPYPTTGDPYNNHHHTSQRDSGDYESYSSGGEDQQPPQFSIPPSSHQHHTHDQQQMYMPFGANDLTSPNGPSNNNAGGGGASPYNGGGSYTSPYPSPSSQQQQQGQSQRGPGGSRLTPVLSQLSIDPLTGYPPSPLSPGSNNGSYGSPGPSRNHGYPGSNSAPSPYGRPAHHAHPRYVSHTHSHSHSTTSSSVPSSASASSQQQQPQQPQQAPPSSIFSPSGIAGGGKIFASNAAVVPPPLGPAPSSASDPHSSRQQTQPPHGQGPPHQQQQQQSRPRKEMVAGTPTHPDIPRPAVVAAPVPVPHLTKKSRGRQVPSINSVGGGAPAQAATPSHSHSRERPRKSGGGSSAHRGGADRLSFEGDHGKLESPISPPSNTPSHGGYFPSTQWSDGEYEERLAAHGHRSLFGQAPVPGVSAGPGPGPGSVSSLSSPATSLSSRRTADDGGPSHSNAPPPPPPQVPSAGVAPGSIEAELRARPFVCTVEGCGKAYIRAEHLKRHVRSIHTNDKPYECPFEGCGREFSRYDNLCQHYKGVHGPTSGMRDLSAQ